MLIPSGPGSLHLEKYACTVRHLGNSLGNMRHCQPLLSRYSTAQNTSCRSTVRGLVCLRTLSSRVNLFERFFADVTGVALSHHPSLRHAIDREQSLRSRTSRSRARTEQPLPARRGVGAGAHSLWSQRTPARVGRINRRALRRMAFHSALAKHPAQCQMAITPYR